MMKMQAAWVLGVIAGWLVTVSVQAQEAQMATATNTIFEEVVVTARRREESSQDVPIPITAMTGDQLETRNIRDITEIEKLTPNTDISSSSVNNSATQVFIRGIGQVNWASTQDPKIGIYVDGVYLSRPQGGLLDLMDVNRVEVLRGPQGTLFGRNTTAGLIHVITNKPSLEREFDVQVGVGSDNHRTYGFTYNQPLTDSLAARVALYSKKTDGFIVNSLTGNDRGNEDSLSYRGTLSWDLENFSAILTYDHFEADELGPLGSCRFTGPDDGNTAGGLASIANIFGIYEANQANCENTTRDVSIDTTNDERVTSDVDAFTLNLSYDLGWAEISSITSQREIDNFNGSWGWVMGNGPGANFLEVLDNDSEHEIFSQELRISGANESFAWTAGAYWFEEESEESVGVPLFRDVAIPTPAQSPLFYLPTGAMNPDGSMQTFGDVAVGTQIFGSRRQSYDVTNKNQAIFAEGTWTFAQDWDLTVGVRYTEDEREFTRIQTLFDGSFDPGYFCPGMPTVEVAPGVLLPASDRCFQEVDYDEVTPRIILQHRINEDVMLYASFSEGYSSGGFNQDARMRPYLPESSDNIEVGTKAQLFDGRVRFNGTLFHNSYENQQLTVGRVVDGQPTADLINAQEATLKGIEMEVLARLTDNFSVALSLGYIEGEYDEFTVDDNLIDPITLVESIVTRDLSGIEFGNNGDELSADISFLHQAFFEWGDITTSLGFSYTDERYYTLLNTPSSKVDSYWLIDARITWSLPNDQTTVSVWGSNLTDEDFVTNMLNQSGDTEIGGMDPSLGFSADYWGDPRRVGLEIRHAF
ncbi:MAG: TonB-dependent receptor [Pseudomonadota bacterium]